MGFFFCLIRLGDFLVVVTFVLITIGQERGDVCLYRPWFTWGGFVLVGLGNHCVPDGAELVPRLDVYFVLYIG